MTSSSVSRIDMLLEPPPETITKELRQKTRAFLKGKDCTTLKKNFVQNDLQKHLRTLIPWLAKLREDGTKPITTSPLTRITHYNISRRVAWMIKSEEDGRLYLKYLHQLPGDLKPQETKIRLEILAEALSECPNAGGAILEHFENCKEHFKEKTCMESFRTGLTFKLCVFGTKKILDNPVKIKDIRLLRSAAHCLYAHQFPSASMTTVEKSHCAKHIALAAIQIGTPATEESKKLVDYILSNGLPKTSRQTRKAKETRLLPTLLSSVAIVPTEWSEDRKRICRLLELRALTLFELTYFVWNSEKNLTYAQRKPDFTYILQEYTKKEGMQNAHCALLSGVKCRRGSKPWDSLKEVELGVHRRRFLAIPMKEQFNTADGWIEKPFRPKAISLLNKLAKVPSEVDPLPYFEEMVDLLLDTVTSLLPKEARDELKLPVAKAEEGKKLSQTKKDATKEQIEYLKLHILYFQKIKNSIKGVEQKGLIRDDNPDTLCDYELDREEMLKTLWEDVASEKVSS